ncbi:hypothetical protein Cgig2_002471 [Carnegiea gigantea]|uniref:Uncharacterized protein n=1 Tax=Carnegiea gigantea TaxID=171969 RepID=A0A9Q1QPG8_9CARY|nr:hypothetical protein Cgig2_002471 [Carnegiea gigantea]
MALYISTEWGLVARLKRIPKMGKGEACGSLCEFDSLVVERRRWMAIHGNKRHSRKLRIDYYYWIKLTNLRMYVEAQLEFGEVARQAGLPICRGSKLQAMLVSAERKIQGKQDFQQSEMRTARHCIAYYYPRGFLLPGILKRIIHKDLWPLLAAQSQRCYILPAFQGLVIIKGYPMYTSRLGLTKIDVRYEALVKHDVCEASEVGRFTHEKNRAYITNIDISDLKFVEKTIARRSAISKIQTRVFYQVLKNKKFNQRRRGIARRC